MLGPERGALSPLQVLSHSLAAVGKASKANKANKYADQHDEPERMTSPFE